MSFDIAFTTCRSSGTEEKINPFTGRAIAAPKAGPLSAAERKATLRFLEDHGFEAGIVQLPDGLELEVSLNEDLTGGMIFLRAATPAVFSFLFHLAEAGSYAMCPIMGDNPVIVTSAELGVLAAESQLLEPNASVHVVGDPNAIAELVCPAFGGWDAYRAKVIGESDD